MSAAALNGLSLEMVTALFSQRVEPQAMLVTIEAAGVSGGPLRFVNRPVGETSTGRPGLVSRGEDYEFFPFEIGFPGAGPGEPARQTEITIANRDARVAEGLESVTGQPALTLELVRVSAPDQVERAMSGAVLTSTAEQGPKITGTLRSRRFDTEPACKVSYISAKTPSLF